jgi:hypothetical protein
MSLAEIQKEISYLSSKHAEIVEVEYLVVNTLSIPVVKLSNRMSPVGTNKATVMVIGRLRGAEPVGTEIIMRLIRHLVTGLSHFLFMQTVAK